MNKITIFLHVCIFKNWRTVYNDIMKKIHESSLIEISNINVIYVNDKIFPEDAKYKNVNYIYGGEMYEYEYPTLKALYDFSINDTTNSNVLYLHTKGITRNEITVHDWRNMMLYFNVEKWQDRIVELNEYDATGCNLSKGIQQGLNATWFSGNFWWSKTEYIKKLKDPNNWKSNRLMAEFWLGTQNGDFKCCHRSGINHYQKLYPREKYVKK